MVPIVRALLRYSPRRCNSKPYILGPKPSTLNPTPSTLNPKPSILNPKPSTLNPKPSILNRKPSTYTPNPQPQTSALNFAASHSRLQAFLERSGLLDCIEKLLSLFFLFLVFLGGGGWALEFERFRVSGFCWFHASRLEVLSVVLLSRVYSSKAYRVKSAQGYASASASREQGRHASSLLFGRLVLSFVQFPQHKVVPQVPS